MITWILLMTAFIAGWLVAKSLTKSNGIRVGDFHCYHEGPRLWIFSYNRKQMEIEAKDEQSVVICQEEAKPVEP